MKRTSLLIVSWLTLAVGSSSAQTSYWDPGNTGGTGSGGDGTWDTVTPNFSNGLAGGQVWNNGDNAVFGGAPGNVSLLGSLSAASLTFQANYNFNLAAGNSLAVTGTVDLGANTLTLAGAGPLQLGGTNGLVGSGTLAFNGGLLQVAGSGLTTNVNATFAANVYSTINTNGFASTWSGNLTGSQGGLVKTGSGDLALGGTNAVGSILVAGGSLSQATGSLTTAELAVGTGAGNTASFTMSGGTITFPAGPVPPLVGGPTAQSSFRVGDFGGTGTFDQTAGTINVSGSINVGNQGGTGTYNLSGGTLNLADGLYNLGRKANASTASASTGTLNLSGTGLVNVQNGAFIIGSRDNGALASTSNGTINQSGGTFRLSGTSLGDALYLSGYGNGTYNLTGGTLEVGGVALQGHYGPGAGTYAFNLGGGTIRVINAALNTSVNANLNPGVYSTVDTNGLGANWSGNFTGAQGGLIKTGAGDLALSGSANVIGSFKVTGGSVTQNSGALSSSEVSVGTDGGTGTYNFGGGTMTLVTGTPPPLVGGSASSLRVGDFNGTGAFNQTGGTINVSGSFNVGNQGGNGTYNLSAGTLNLADGIYNLGRKANASGLVSTGVLNLSGTGLLNVTNGNFILGSRDNGVNASLSSGTLTQTGGTFRVNGTGGATNLFLGGFGSGTYNLLGGSLEIGGSALQGNYLSSSAPYAFNLGGGTIRVINAALTTSVNANLNAGVYSTIDTNGLGGSWAGNFTGAQGGLVKTGAGDLALSGSANVIGSFKVTGGSVTQNSGTLSSAEVSVGTDGGTGTYNFGGGTINLVTGTPPPLVGGSASSLRVGDFNGTGAFNQTGGTINVSGSFNVGNQGGNGTYNLSAGTLNLADGIYNLGRKANGSTVSASTGVLNLSGTGLVNVSSGNFILGSRDNGALASTSSGTINQTGGIFRVNGTGGATNLFLGGFGPGTYNLNGGALEIGGNALQGNYLSSTNPYAFNLGGGTVRVINQALTTSVAATLTGGSTSTIDTNGLGATWSGRLSGTGSLTKAGAGTLTLASPTGNTFTGTTTVNQGVLRLAGTVSAAALGGTSAITIQSGGSVVQAAAAQINPAANLTLNGGTFDTGGFNTTLGTLTVSNFGSIIDMASGGPNVLSFADSSGTSWTGTLSIFNWSGQIIDHQPGGDVLSGDPAEALIFGNSPSGLTSGQLASIRFYSDSGLTFVGTGESLGTGGNVIAVIPEPTTYLAAALALGLVGWRIRGRRAAKAS